MNEETLINVILSTDAGFIPHTEAPRNRGSFHCGVVRVRVRVNYCGVVHIRHGSSLSVTFPVDSKVRI